MLHVHVHVMLHACYMHMLSCYMYMHATYTMYMYLSMLFFVLHIKIFAVSSAPVLVSKNRLTQCTIVGHAGRELGGEERERATLSFPIIDQTTELFNCTSNNTGTMHTHVYMCTIQAQNYHQKRKASQYKVHMPVSCTCTCI